MGKRFLPPRWALDFYSIEIVFSKHKLIKKKIEAKHLSTLFPVLQTQLKTQCQAWSKQIIHKKMILKTSQNLESNKERC